MEYLTPNFTKDMLKDYTILIPSMAPVQFECMKSAMESEGYHVELLTEYNENTASLGLRYVHNDTCYPALLIIGQFLEALNSGKYDLKHTALLISQSGGGCRASNYIKLLRKALVKAGYGYIPVASINASGLEKDSSIPLSLRLVRKIAAAAEYGDEISALRNQIAPYEDVKGSADQWVSGWIKTVDSWFRNNKSYSLTAVKRNFRAIAQSASEIAITRTDKVKVGVVGEIFVKFSPSGNNNLQTLLEHEGCEVNLPGIMGYVQYCCANVILDNKYYGMSRIAGRIAGMLLKTLDQMTIAMNKAMQDAGFSTPGSFRELMSKPEGILDLGVKMGEGWLLTAEMVELIESGYSNIVCAQPFGCLPNHICGKGVSNRIRQLYPDANITAVDYDPGASRVNQENRIKLMLAVAKEKHSPLVNA